MKTVAVIVLIAFMATFVAGVPASAAPDKREGRKKPPPQEKPKPPPNNDNDDTRRPPREKPRNDDGTREPREKGDAPSHDRDVAPDPIYWPALEYHECTCGESPCWFHDTEIYYMHGRYYGYRYEQDPAVGIFGLASATIMALNLIYAADEGRRHEAIGVAGLVLGGTGMVWSFGADNPWHARTLFFVGALSTGFALYQLSLDEERPEGETVPYRSSASISFSF